MKDANKMINDCKKVGEPFFVFRAKDIHSLPVLEEYMRLLIKNDCSPSMYSDVRQTLESFREWRRNHKDKVRMPD